MSYKEIPMLTPTHGSVDNSIDSLVQGYLEIAPRELNKSEFFKHRQRVHEAMNSKKLTKEDVIEIMATLLVEENGAEAGRPYYNDASLTNILKSCEEFTWKHLIGSKKDIVDITDKEAVEEISDFIINVLDLYPFPSGNEELSIILASYLLKKIQKPYLLIDSAERNGFIEALANKFLMRVFVANKYKQSFISQNNNKLYKVVEAYDNASKYTSDGISGFYVLEWHELNSAINDWTEKS